MILPAAENKRSGAAEVRTFRAKRAIHGFTKEARLNSVRGFLCDGNGCRCILHKAISSLAMSELDLMAGQEKPMISRYLQQSPRRRLLENLMGPFFSEKYL